MSTAVSVTYDQSRSVPADAVRFGVIGYGYWGPNVARNLSALPGAHLVGVCDKNTQALQRASLAHPDPNLILTTNASDIIESPNIDAVAVVTPVWSHYELGRAALNNGKHIFVEKPFTFTAAQAIDLIELAEKRNRKIMVDHTFLFTGAVRKIHQLVSDGTLGKLYYYDSMRVNLGLFQHDINVIWDLAPHDLSIMDFLISARPEAISATAQTHLNGHEDIAFITIYYPEGLIAHVNVNWLSPVKVRTTLVGGEKKMLVWNDLDRGETIKVYDKGVVFRSKQDIYELLVSYRSGDMWAPQLEQGEALQNELQSFLDSITQDQPLISDGVTGLRVVRMLEAASKSVAQRGQAVYL